MWRQLVLIVILASASGTAGAHARLTAPVPRNEFDDITDTNAEHPSPCGGPRSTVVMAQPVGNTIVVTWDETIDHQGHYEILFSMASDLNFTFLTDPSGVTLDNITDVQGGTLPHHYTQTVKLPSTPCPACTLQVKQFMLGAGYYMSCADMQLTAVAASPAPIATAPDDAGAPPDLAQAATTPTPADSTPTPSAQPAADDPGTMTAAPDMASAVIGPTKYDYSYGCSSLPGSTARGPIGVMLMLLSALGIARIATRSRSR